MSKQGVLTAENRVAALLELMGEPDPGEIVNGHHEFEIPVVEIKSMEKEPPVKVGKNTRKGKRRGKKFWLEPGGGK
jgi:hypothetical protein